MATAQTFGLFGYLGPVDCGVTNHLISGSPTYWFASTSPASCYFEPSSHLRFWFAAPRHDVASMADLANCASDWVSTPSFAILTSTAIINDGNESLAVTRSWLGSLR